MQIKSTVRQHLILVTMAIIKNAKDNECWWVCGENGTLAIIGRNVEPVWKTVG